MVLSSAFLDPLGLAALGSVLALLVLYLFKPDPDRIEVPTARFLLEEREDENRSMSLRRLRRNWLLLVQLLVLVLVSLAIASPYVTVTEAAAEETVLVVDATASMATERDGGTRFGAAVDRAKEAVAARTSVVVSGATSRVVVRRGSATAAERALDSLSVTDAPGDLGDAIARATAIAGRNATLVVVSDFVDDGDWRSTVQAAQARGIRVDLVQVGRDDVDNVGITDYAFEGGEVTLTVRNFGDAPAARTVSLGGERRTVRLRPGDVATPTLPVPAGGGRATLSPGDAFPTDDSAPIAAPPDPTIDVLVFTNGGNRFLTTALSLVEGVEVTVATPPTTVSEEYDVIVFSEVVPDKVLPGNVRTARELLERGGGVVIQAQPDVGAVGYGDLLLVDPRGVGNATEVRTAGADPLVEGVTFTAPEQYVSGSLRSGRALLETRNGSPLLALDRRGSGTVMYYGFMKDASEFKYNYMYPVFWKRAVYQLAGQPTLSDLNRETGTRLSAGGGTVVGPDGTDRGSSAVLDRVGVYSVGDRRVAAALVSEAESNVSVPSVADLDAPAKRSGTRPAPLDLAPLVAGGAVLASIVELLALRRRGDL